MKSSNFEKEGKDLALTPVRGKVKKTGKVTKAVGFRTVMTGLRQYQALPDVPFISEVITSVFPEPQIFQGRLHSIIIMDEKPYRIDGDTLVAMSIGADNSASNTNALTSNNIWTYADLGDYFVIANGNKVIYGNCLTDTYYIARPRISCVGMYKGRVAYAGFDQDSTFNQEWIDFFQEFEESIPVVGLRQNYVMLCPVDTDPFWLFNPPTARVKALIESSEIMYAPIRTESQIIGIGELNNGLMVYTHNEVYTSNVISQPMFAFSRIKTMDFGLLNQGSIHTAVNKHLLVSNTNRVIAITDSFDEMEYEQQVQELDNDCRVLHDQNKDDYYIVDGSYTYLLTKFGLTEVAGDIASLYNKNITYKI